VFFFPVALQPKSGLDRLPVEVSRSHTIRHIYPVGLLRTSDELVTGDEKPMPSAGFEPAIPAIERSQAYALDDTATRIGYTDLVADVN
jgi:hypothetical protein